MFISLTLFPSQCKRLTVLRMARLPARRGTPLPLLPIACLHSLASRTNRMARFGTARAMALQATPKKKTQSLKFVVRARWCSLRDA